MPHRRGSKTTLRLRYGGTVSCQCALDVAEVVCFDLGLFVEVEGLAAGERAFLRDLEHLVDQELLKPQCRNLGLLLMHACSKQLRQNEFTQERH